MPTPIVPSNVPTTPSRTPYDPSGPGPSPVASTPAPGKVNYFAISMLSSKTFWLNALMTIVALSEMTELTTLIPPAWMPRIMAVVAIANVLLRRLTQRPATFIMPGNTEVVQVDKVGPPPPSKLTD